MSGAFFQTVRDLRQGATIEEADHELQQLVAAVRATGKPGEITLKLKVKPGSKGAVSYVTVEDSISVKTPKLDRSDTVFYPTADNTLTRQDPSQRELELRVVKVDHSTGEVIGEVRSEARVS